MADEKEKKVADTSKKEKVAKTKSQEKTKTKATEKKEVTTKKEENKTVENKTAKKEIKKEKEVKKANNQNENIAEELTAKAILNNARISNRKVAIVANLIRGKNVDDALAILKFTQKAASPLLEKLLKSAIANAENNNQMDHSKLYIAEIYSNQGPTLKRIRPAAKGSAVRIRKRTSNTTIVLKERV